MWEKRKRKRLSLKKAAKRLSKLIYKHLIEEPEKEREENIAALERAVTKRLRRRRAKTRAKK